MLLQLAPKGKPLNTTYSTPEGRLVYRIVDDVTASPRLIRVEKFDGEKDAWNCIGAVEAPKTGADILVWSGGERTEVDEFFLRKESGGPLGRDRIFTCPKGKEYGWGLGPSSCELFTVGEDGEQYMMTTYTSRRRGIFHKKSPALLEIRPEVEEIADLIMITFACVENERKVAMAAYKEGAKAVFKVGKAAHKASK